MKITLEIQRFNPKKDKEPYFEKFDVEAEKTHRILDALVYIYRNIDGSLSFRKSCAHGICGSDAMRINGKERLACKTLVRDVADKDGDIVRIEPLRHLEIQKDLMVDQTPFFEKLVSVKPYFIQGQVVVEKEYIQSQDERKEFDAATKCISCGACYSACPILDKNEKFLGPAALVHAARFVFDSREAGIEKRIEVLDHTDGVWSCENHFECTRVCPREIPVTKLINLTKRKIKKYREERGETTSEAGNNT
jgi:succinate dehydrogenase / fumarate reductase iron-sulfur subunit